MERTLAWLSKCRAILIRRDKMAEKVTEGVFTFVAIDEEGRPRPLPAG